ncbi:DNA polymerase IV [Candidatus Parcubacteria bacterium]|nr:DNA polymerase IV [Candidatus Parcubacteria bacterium]
MILHIDGDAFFASCEIAQNEAFRGKPVVAGADRSIALAVSYEAKKRGISRGMLIGEIKKICPEAIITLSHYDTYRTYAQRMYSIVRRYAPMVEEYSIDECFGDLTPLLSRRGERGEAAVQAAKNIKRDLERDLGMTFSIGLAPTKVLAKVASKWNKPSGFTVLEKKDIPQFLEKMLVGKIWGIGPSGSANLMKHGVRIALEFIQKPEWWIRENLSKPYEEIWHELNGRSILRVHEDERDDQKSIMKTGTFKPITKDPKVLLAELSKNAERACKRLRRHYLITKHLYFYIKTQKFTYRSTEVTLPLATSNPMDIVDQIHKNFHKIYSPHYDYRATGVVFRSITPAATFQPDLFGETQEVENRGAIFSTIDLLSKKFGRDVVTLARTLLSNKRRDKRFGPQQYPDFKRLGIPYWGEAH